MKFERYVVERKPVPLERDIQASIMKYLKSKRIFHYKAIVSSQVGIPDIICCIHGKFVAFEVKRSDRAKVSPIQLRVADDIRSAGGDSYIVWSLDMVKEIIETYEC